LTRIGAPYPESLDTTRFDGGVVAQMPVADRYLLTARMSATRKDEDYLRGDVRERDIQDTVFAELAVRGTAPRQTWVGGVAFERSVLDPRDEPRFAYQYNVPGAFLQDDIDVRRWLTLSISGRVDVHSEFGTFLSPARLGTCSGRRVDQSRLDRQRILCSHGAHRGNGSRRTRDSHD
jgi:hypothetical protein